MPRPLLIFSQSDNLIQIVNINSQTKWQTVQVQISWLFQKPTDLDLYSLQRQGVSGFSRTRVKGIDTLSGEITLSNHFCLSSEKGFSQKMGYTGETGCFFFILFLSHF